MTLPYSVRRAFARHIHKADELRLLKNSATKNSPGDLEIEIGYLTSAICTSLDMVMGHVFSTFGPKDGKKPHIYFPCCESSDRLKARLQKDKLLGLVEDAPELLEVIEEVQPYCCSDGWWPEIYRIAGMRHERFPEVRKNFSSNSILMGLGGQGAHIKQMKIGQNGVEVLDAFGLNAKTGLPEPLRMRIHGTIVEDLEGTGKSPVGFIGHCARQAELLAKKIGVHLQ